MVTDPELLPWHVQQWARMRHSVVQQQLSHALLLHGPQGLGKRPFMERLARSLLCIRPEINDADIAPCRHCHACLQFTDEGAHADILRMSPEEGSREIKIDQTRQAVDFAYLAPHYGGRKLILIDPAESMNHNAANALLKILEEPPEAVILLLCSDKPSGLLPTIRSRCQQLRFSTPEPAATIPWLEARQVTEPAAVLAEVQNRPMLALSMAQEGLLEWRQSRDRELAILYRDSRSPTRLANIWSEHEHSALYAWLYDRLRRFLWFHQGPSNAVAVPEVLQDLCTSLTVDRIEQIIFQLNQYSLSDKTRINKQLEVESILFTVLGQAS